MGRDPPGPPDGGGPTDDSPTNCTTTTADDERPPGSVDPEALADAVEAHGAGAVRDDVLVAALRGGEA